jgi:hypothetical protein
MIESRSRGLGRRALHQLKWLLVRYERGDDPRTRAYSRLPFPDLLPDACFRWHEPSESRVA